MAYRIDFTEANYINRSRRKFLLRLVTVAAIAIAVWGIQDIYTTYNQPTLNMRLAEYESVARPIEEMNLAWDTAANEYNAMLKYYRLLWASSPTNFLSLMASDAAPRLKPGLRPVSWSLTTGGACQIDYAFTFDFGDKAEQTKGLEDWLVNSVTSVVQVVGGKVEVSGVQHQNLLNVNSLNITLKFSLPDVRTFPAKEKTLADCVAEIALMRKKVKEAKIADGDTKSGANTAQGIMMAYLAIGRDKPDFPDLASVINVSGWFDRADRFIMKNRIPGDEKDRRKLREIWNKVGEARYPWQSFRMLDNEEFVYRTQTLGKVSDGVKRFKRFLELRHIDNLKKLEPFIDAYEHNDVFNRPLVEADLKDRVAKPLGVPLAVTSFSDEKAVTPPTLEQKDEKFTFSWVRWSLSVGAKHEGEEQAELTLAQVAECAKKTVELGPGYALDSIRIRFGERGDVTDAVLTGLLPVKQVAAIKEEKK